MPEDYSGDGQEKTRLCPTCRMSISVLATKCRYCGETLSRPKDATRRLSVDDLGGESTAGIRRSEDVMEALEAYRREEYADQAASPPEQPSWLHPKDGAPGDAPPQPSAFPEFDAPDSGGLYDARPPSPYAFDPRAVPKKPAQVSWTNVYALIGYAVGGVVLVIILATGIKGLFGGPSESQSGTTAENPAVAVMNAGGPAIEALRLAIEALKQSDTQNNRGITEKARLRFKDEIEGLLNSPTWDLEVLKKAATLVNEAEAMDPDSPIIRDLKKQVIEEDLAYRMTVRPPIDLDKGQVTLTVQCPGKDPETVLKQKGETVQDRFRIKALTRDYVWFEDMKRKKASGQPREFRLSVQGRIMVL